MRILIIYTEFCLTNAAYHAQHRPNWKLVKKNDVGMDEIIPTTNIRGDLKFRCTAELTTGYYELSIGTGISAHRKKFFVNEEGKIQWLNSKNKVA